MTGTFEPDPGQQPDPWLVPQVGSVGPSYGDGLPDARRFAVRSRAITSSLSRYGVAAAVLDSVVVVLAMAASVASFLPFAGISRIFGLSVSLHVTAWQSFAPLGLLCLFAGGASAVGGIATTARRRPSGVAFDVGSAALAGAGTALLLVRGLTYGLYVHLEWGGWLLISIGVAQVGFATASAFCARAAARQISPATDVSARS